MEPFAANLMLARLEALEKRLHKLGEELSALRLSELPGLLLETTKQMEALDRLLLLLDRPRGWLPPTRGWAASPDLLLIIAEHLLTHRPERVLELGAGASSYVIARALEINGMGRLTSLEHQAAYQRAVTAGLAERGLSQRAEVLLAPLKAWRIGEESHDWYDIEALPPWPIDLLIIDGPPASNRPDARYAAGPLLLPRIEAGGHVICDDLHRPGDLAVVQRWLRDIPGFQARTEPTEKGCAILTRA